MVIVMVAALEITAASVLLSDIRLLFLMLLLFLIIVLLLNLKICDFCCAVFVTAIVWSLLRYG